jgi:hypothetical protein
LADHAVSRLENEFKANEGDRSRAGAALEEYSFKIQARGRDAVRDGLHRLGLTIYDKLGLGSSATVDDVLGSDSKPQRLRNFLQKHRFVIVADDCDAEGCSELLLHVPPSTKPCALVVTSQYGSDVIPQLEGSARAADLVRIHLDCFQPHVSLQLVDAVCGHDNYSSVRDDLLQWMTGILDHLGQLPLAVRLFAEWLHQELLQAAHDKATVGVADLRSRWDREYADEADDCAGVLGSVIGSRGLRATVRLALGNLKAHGDYEACRQLLGLLALCPPTDVPWSLFDGVLHVSAAGQACRVRREDGGGGVAFDDAVVASDKVVKDGESVVLQLQDGKKSIMARSRVEFGPHILGMVVKDGRYQVQLLTPQPYMRGARVELHGFVKAVANNGLHGRVVQRHDDGTVSVVFGCETGERSPPAAAAPALASCDSFFSSRRRAERGEASGGGEAVQSGQRARAGRGGRGPCGGGGGGSEAGCCGAAAQRAGAGGGRAARVWHAPAAAAGGGPGAGLGRAVRAHAAAAARALRAVWRRGGL